MTCSKEREKRNPVPDSRDFLILLIKILLHDNYFI